MQSAFFPEYSLWGKIRWSSKHEALILAESEDQFYGASKAQARLPGMERQQIPHILRIESLRGFQPDDGWTWEIQRETLRLCILKWIYRQKQTKRYFGYTAKGHNLYFPYAPSPSGGGLGWGFKRQDYARSQVRSPNHRLCSWIPQNVMPGLFSTNLLDQSGIKQRSQ